MMVYHINQNLSIGLVVSSLFHLLLFLFISIVSVDTLGVIKENPADMITVDLVHPIRPGTGDGGTGTPKTDSRKSLGRSTRIDMPEAVPEIKMDQPEIKKMDHELAITKKSVLEEWIIKQREETPKQTENIQLKEQVGNQIPSSGKGTLSDMPKISESLSGTEKGSQPGSGTTGSGKGIGTGTGSSGGLPQGLTIDGLIGGQGQVLWSPDNKMPAYPEIAQKQGWQGTVKIKLKVNKTGQVQQVIIEEKSGYPVLDQAVLREAQKWKITILDQGLKRSGQIRLSMTFTLK